MLIDKTIFTLFKQGSRTYFYSSIFFPTMIRKDVFILYAFVRKTDNYVDSIPQDVNGFYEFRERFDAAWHGKVTDDIVVDSFVFLAKEKKFDRGWIDAFFTSMEMDITKKTYDTMDETLQYIYGSAEVIGLMMARILGLVDRSFEHAKYLGRAMQYINFIRDIDEDIKLGRRYFPTEELTKYGLSSLSFDVVVNQPEQFTAFMHAQLERYCGWQEWAEHGYGFIPRRYLIPIKTASEMYKWTGRQIYKNPLLVYKYKVKPMVSKIITKTIINMIEIMVRKDQRVECHLHRPK
ncbi:MAG: phytoene/squalene synthase family protein [Thermoplasmatota archaeon]